MLSVLTWTRTQQTQNICVAFMQCWANVKDVGPSLHKCYTNVFCLLGNRVHDTRKILARMQGAYFTAI